jgi:hypothetical protein
MLDWLTMGLGKAKEKKIQFFIHDDDSIEFVKRTIEDTVLIEMRNGKPVAAFKHYYKLEYDFEGYKNLPAGKITLGYPRDVILDLFNTLEVKDKFTKGNDLNRPWITDIGANAFYKAKTQKAPSLLMDRFSVLCMFLVAGEAIAILFKVLM